MHANLDHKVINQVIIVIQHMSTKTNLAYSCSMLYHEPDFASKPALLCRLTLIHRDFESFVSFLIPLIFSSNYFLPVDSTLHWMYWSNR